MIGLKDSRQFFNQREAKPKAIAPCMRDFSRALSELLVIAGNCDWFIALFAPVVIQVEGFALVLVFQQSFENRSTCHSNLRLQAKHLIYNRNLHFQASLLLRTLLYHSSFDFCSF